VTPGAPRFEALTLYRPTVDGLRASMEWLESQEVGWAWAHQRIAQMGRRCHELLSGVPGVRLLMEPGDIAGLVTFTVRGVAPDDLTERLAAQGMTIRSVPVPHANRVSTGFFNTEHELIALAQAIEGLAR
jgi:selenocysteine lyase/cysteine desulfurase